MEEVDNRIRASIVEKCRAIADNPEDNDLIIGYLYEINELTELLFS